MVKKLRKGEKKILFFFYNLVHIFPLPLRKNTKPLTFSALFITRNRKTVWENIPCKIFLFLVVYIRLVLEHLARKTYLAYIHSNPNCPCTPNTPDLHAGLPQFCMYEKHFFRTRTREAILHVRKTHLAYGSVSVSVSIVQTGGSGPPSTKNIPHLHALGPQFCMYGKHAWPTYTITPILHLRKTRLAYIHNYPNSACTQITFFVHAAILHVHIWRWGVLDQQTKNIPHLHALGPQFCMYTSGAGN